MIKRYFKWMFSTTPKEENNERAMAFMFTGALIVAPVLVAGSGNWSWLWLIPAMPFMVVALIAAGT